MHRLQMQMLGSFAEWQARVKQMNTNGGIAVRQQNDDYHHGGAPLGFEKEDGELFKGSATTKFVRSSIWSRAADSVSEKPLRNSKPRDGASGGLSTSARICTDYDER